MVLRLAPEKHHRFLSWMCGCLLAFTWQAYLAAAAWFFGLNVSAMITLYTSKYKVYYTFTPTVFMLAGACIANLTWGRHMNILETLALVVQSVTFLLILVILALANSTRTLTASFTFATLTGWPNWVGASLAMAYCTGVLGGFDCAAHLCRWSFPVRLTSHRLTCL